MMCDSESPARRNARAALRRRSTRGSAPRDGSRPQDAPGRRIDAPGRGRASFAVLSRRLILPVLGGALVGAVAMLVVVDRLLRLDAADPMTHLVMEFAGTVVFTFVGTFAGAWAAFRLQTRREDAAIRSARAAALRDAQFALVAQASVLRGFRNHQEIPAINLASVGFLLTSDDPDLPNVLLDCQNKCNTAVGILEDRFEEMRRFLKKVETAQKDHTLAEVATADKVRHAVGPEICGALRTMTDDLYDAVDRAITANNAAFTKLEQQLPKQFPGETVLHRTMEPPESVASRPAGAAKSP